ncbi:hypothetical protein EVAR_3177_1 [Eumeta japonica]|uniref:Uncharacterized protein n=1 Tax=Eumeta variegata TaxID=151549 RepID=A0A4C1XJT9_EUMVA|nr:hypothetical protein EVAR_3177_1 [Eumeta japonica]
MVSEDFIPVCACKTICLSVLSTYAPKRTRDSNGLGSQRRRYATIKCTRRAVLRIRYIMNGAAIRTLRSISSRLKVNPPPRLRRPPHVSVVFTPERRFLGTPAIASRQPGLRSFV